MNPGRGEQASNHFFLAAFGERGGGGWLITPCYGTVWGGGRKGGRRESNPYSLWLWGRRGRRNASSGLKTLLNFEKKGKKRRGFFRCTSIQDREGKKRDSDHKSSYNRRKHRKKGKEGRRVKGGLSSLFPKMRKGGGGKHHRF